MYFKCGCIDSVKRVFDEIFDKDVCVWIVMIYGFVNYGMSKDVLNLFE